MASKVAFSLTTTRLMYSAVEQRPLICFSSSPLPSSSSRVLSHQFNHGRLEVCFRRKRFIMLPLRATTEKQGQLEGRDVDDKILPYCSIDQKERKSLSEMEQDFLQALQAFYYEGKAIMSNEEFDNLEASMAYVAGNPIMNDEEFDKLKMKLKVYSDLSVDYLKMFLLNVPATFVALGLCGDYWSYNEVPRKCGSRFISKIQNHCVSNFLRHKAGGSRYQMVTDAYKNISDHVSTFFIQVVAVMLVTSTLVVASDFSSLALTEENLLFLEAWRTIDRAYVDKNFNGQNWFRYRENALRGEPMNTRDETYAAIKKMLATLDDPFTRLLEPEKFKSLRSGTRGALTGVGLSIGYPGASDGSPAGLVVVSATPGGPAAKAGILPGDVILTIDNLNAESLGIYDAADMLQGPEGSLVEVTVRSGTETKQFALTREKVSLNPVKSRLCEIPGSGSVAPKIGYIKLTSFNENASGAVKEAITTLRSNGVDAFVLDLRDNSGGLFPEGIEIAKIWLEKGVIVYICDSRGVRDIYDTDGSSTIAGSEPLAVLVNKGTASASEILAGALKDNKRAVLFGEPTYGKGKIQSVFQLSDGSGLAVTVARYETPAHTDIDKVGVIPNHPLPQSFPKDENSFCGCLKDADSACYLNQAQLFSR